MKKLILIILVVAVVLLQYRLWFAEGGLIQIFRLKGDIREQKAKNDDILEQNASLVEDIDSLKKGGDVIEDRARSDLGMVKRGEVFYQVVKEEQ